MFNDWLCIFLARLIVPKYMKVVPRKATMEMLDVEFYGDLGSGVCGKHKYLRADEYFFPKREDAVAFGAKLYAVMVDAA